MPLIKYFWVRTLLLAFSVALVHAEDEIPTVTLNSTDDDLNQSESSEKTISTSPSDDIPDPIGMPKSTKPKPHHHSKQKDPMDNLHSHRSPVYEIVNQPCTSYGCRGYEGGYQRWQSKGNRFGPYPQSAYEPRRRGPYQQDFYPDGFYGPRDQDYGYGYRGYPPVRGRYGEGYGRYNQPLYGDQFMGPF